MVKEVPIDITKRAKEIGFIVPYHEFVTMSNPKHRGSAWDWKNFVSYTVRIAEVTCWRSFTDEEFKKWGEEILNLVRSSARLNADTIIKNSGILDSLDEKS
jgi:hypothetical protein